MRSLKLNQMFSDEDEYCPTLWWSVNVVISELIEVDLSLSIHLRKLLVDEDGESPCEVAPKSWRQLPCLGGKQMHEFCGEIDDMIKVKRE